jgi:hypothetical protein
MRVRASASATRLVSHVIPTASPLLCNISRRAATAGWIKYQIAGIGGHEQTTFNNLDGCLDYEYLIAAELILTDCVCPDIAYCLGRKVFKVPYIGELVTARNHDAVRRKKSSHPCLIRLPADLH